MGLIQRAYSAKTASQPRRPARVAERTSGWLSTAQAAPAMASRGSFCPPEMMSLVLAEIRSRPEACAVHDGNG